MLNPRTWKLIIFTGLTISFILGGCRPERQVSSSDSDVLVSAPLTVVPSTPTTTPSPSPTPTEPPTETPPPTWQPKPPQIIASDTPVPMQEVATQAVVGPVPESFPFTLQVGSLRYSPNFTHPELACQWVGIGGQVFEDDRPTSEVHVAVVSGLLSGVPVERIGLTGQNTGYGPSGYEILLGDDPQAFEGNWTVQLFSLNGIELSPAFSFKPGSDCQTNLLIVNFNLQSAVQRMYFPLVSDE